MPENILAGIAIAIVLYLGNCIKRKITRTNKEKKIYSWLMKNTNDKAGEQFKTTNEISQTLGIDENQVKEACTMSKRIYQHRGKRDLWGIHGDEATSIYEERGLIVT